MSCCGENFSCGSTCGGCKMYPDSGVDGAAAETLVLGVAPQKAYAEVSETVVDAAENGCKCGDNCTCNPCNCK